MISPNQNEDKMKRVEKYLAKIGVNFNSFKHKPVYTVEDAKKLGLNFPNIKGSKNLFLRDKK